METIWKFPIGITDEQIVHAPGPFVPLSVQFQDGTLCIWAVVDPAAKSKHSHRVWVVGTGNPLQWTGEKHFLGTAQHVVGGTTLVWHVFTDVRRAA